MQRSRDKKQKKFQSSCSQAFCGTCRLSVSSSSPEEAEAEAATDEAQTVSSIAHAMVQVRLDQMIRERRRRAATHEQETKLVVIVAMEKSSYDPREDFRDSMEQIIVANRIHETKDLRRLLNYYVSMNSEEFRGTILEVFHQVCTDLFVHF
ncbi:probable transcription repressor OFP9 [Salvia miltiorrhiza]|uniref:probable transcription repressor OFP9 n=1 Tax=Salvia miltiorrhiza TaxID=226208 RepID=UPI0025AC5E78|nr:probable transcription repressor OFP9 [Salvia miltiorrhiza]